MNNNGKIYIAINKLSKKVYIGQTIRTLNDRISKHYYKSRNLNNTYKFMNALRKYDITDWIWEIVEDNIPLIDLDMKEIFYINYYNSFNKGYNSTLGGNTYIRTAEINNKSSISAKKRFANIPKELHYNYGKRISRNKIIYNFINKDNITFSGTINEFKNKFNLKLGVYQIINNKTGKYLDWTLIN